MFDTEHAHRQNLTVGMMALMDDRHSDSFAGDRLLILCPSHQHENRSRKGLRDKSALAFCQNRFAVAATNLFKLVRHTILLRHKMNQPQILLVRMLGDR
jgi:hypothetical protein